MPAELPNLSVGSTNIIPQAGMCVYVCLLQYFAVLFLCWPVCIQLPPASDSHKVRGGPSVGQGPTMSEFYLSFLHFLY